ncbi:MAG: hypothetical protein GTO46_15845 [Gemmatimonadetes bacterium]|nr:hypothetical protein [Gemmatimonadota bacterium]NIO33109.1 hypothetical protein [Gemmatimonadota bacterium]
MRRHLLPFVFACAVVLAGCDDERASGELVGPLAGAHVAESVLALAVFQGVPVGITDTFVQDEIVHLWVRWNKLEPPHDAEAVWYDPNANEVDVSLVEILDGPAEQITVFTLDLTPVSMTGFWEVDLWLDGEFHRSHLFEVVPGAVLGE